MIWLLGGLAILGMAYEVVRAERFIRAHQKGEDNAKTVCIPEYPKELDRETSNVDGL